MATMEEEKDECKQEMSKEDPPFLYDGLVTVLVGPEKHRFDIHKTLLCKSSDFFEVAFNGSLKEKEGTTTLPEQDVSTFKYYVHWLYTRNLSGYFYPPPKTPTVKELETTAREEMAEKQQCELYLLDMDNSKWQNFYLAQYRDLPFHSLIELYILADALQVRGLKGRIITTLISVYGYTVPKHLKPLKSASLPFWEGGFRRPDWMPPTARAINLAFENLPRCGALRAVLTLLFVDNISTAFFSKEDLCCEFLGRSLNMVIGRWSVDRATTPWDKQDMICNFHQHDIPCDMPPARCPGCAHGDSEWVGTI
ncbi:hypothetical protein OEA41_005779 [Lepraria neglecta]|uniref:BTB domain-containing protein n=1 Tax=Lepraria neglecta TaxID=209136 RepID=A0AAD9Z984_9LECA|nr:hypothetical protein OEA41_005779 [Lepraria neglecta]